MNPSEILRIVDAIHLDKNIDKEIVFEGIEAALVSALKKYYGEESEVDVQINREDGTIFATCNGEVLDSEDVVGRIGAQTAKQVMIQKIREAERDALFDEYSELQGYMVSGVIQRYEGGAATVSLTNCEAILPRSEQIPGETHHVNERVRATVYEVRKAGSRIKVILSRRAPQLVQRLFEQEIPEIADGVIEIKAMSREPGYRSKVAVVSSDQRVDCVGACVGVRGNRIKNIVDELAGERIDIVRWDENLEVLIPNALQPAEVEQVILCKMLGRAIVLVREDQLSLAIGRRGQNVRLASKLSGWDIEIMTQEELAESIDRAVVGFGSLDGVEIELAEKLVEEGFLSYDDLSIIEPDSLVEMGQLSEEQVETIIEQAETHAEEAEAAAQQARRAKKEQQKLAELAAEVGDPLSTPASADETGTAAAEESPTATGAGEQETGEQQADDEQPTGEQDTAQQPPGEEAEEDIDRQAHDTEADTPGDGPPLTEAASAEDADVARQDAARDQLERSVGSDESSTHAKLPVAESDESNESNESDGPAEATEHGDGAANGVADEARENASAETRS